MSKSIKAPQPVKTGDPRFYMANERTFLAWIRTSIGLMGFGFVVERFSLFVKQMTYILGKDDLISSSHGSSAIVGIVLVGLGAIMSVSAFIKYRQTDREITEGTYRSSSILNTALTALVLAVGIFLVFYIIQST